MAYALSKIILKSFFAILAKPSMVSLEYVSPVGFECFGTQIIPLMDSSVSNKLSIKFKSGPSPKRGTGIILMPIFSSIAKCLSYPGTGHKKVIFFRSFQGTWPLP